MRTLLLAAAAFGLTTAANAQNVASTSQTGDNHDATVDQTFTSGAVNSASITQATGNGAAGLGLGFGHDADITQLGGGNTATIEQIQGVRLNNGTRQDFSEASIEQDGQRNTATIEQGLASSTTGGGFSSESVQTQTGDDNVASSIGLRSSVYTEQTQTGNANSASIFGRNEQNSDIVQTQIGDRNTATSEGLGENRSNDFDQFQEGDDNTASIVSSEGFSAVDQDQIGTFNQASASIDGRVLNVTQLQSGDYNVSQVDVVSTTQRSADTQITTNQYGGSMANPNQAFVTNGAAGMPVIDNTVTIDQGMSGLAVFGNTATVNQMTDANTATVSQMGNNNTSAINQ